MNKIFLKLAMLPSGLWRGMGADTDQLEAILDIRLKIDDRKPMPIGRQRAQKKEQRNGTLRNMFLSLIAGVIYMLPVVSVQDRIFGLAISFTFFLFMLTLMLITDFSNVLFDTRDKYIIIPRPVNDVTIVLSRLLHVFIYLFRIVLPMSLPAWIAVGVMDGWKSAVLYVFPLILMVFIAVFLVNFIYLLLLKLAKPERFKDIINYFQIIFSIVFFASWYLMNGLLRGHGDGTINLDINNFSWFKYLPSYWLASFWTIVGFPAKLQGTQWFYILAIVLPLVCLWVLVKYLAPQFARNIGDIDVVASAEYTPVTTQKNTSGTKLYQKMANLFNKNDIAKAGFIITWLQTSRSRSFKMKVYPTFAYAPVYFIYMLTTMSDHKSFKEVMVTLPDSPVFLILLYMCALVLVQALTYLTISDQYKAAWVYYAAPVTAPGNVMAGAFKAMWVKFFLPLFTVLAIVIVSIWGWHTIIDVALALVNVTLFAACIMRVTQRHLPFSMQENINQGGNRIIKSLISMAVPGALGFGHYLAINLVWLKILFMVLSAILLWLVWDSFKNTTWDVIRKTEFD